MRPNDPQRPTMGASARRNLCDIDSILLMSVYPIDKLQCKRFDESRDPPPIKRMVLILRPLEELSWRVLGRLPPLDLDKLDEDAVECIGVEERDPGAVSAPPRRTIDQADPDRTRPRQRSIDVRNLERQVVNPFAPHGQEPVE